MDNTKTVKMLAALAQEDRLKIIQELVMTGPEGLCPCHLVEELNMTNANLSFHLKELKNAELVDTERRGKFIHYHANCDLIKQLSDSLICNCTKYKCKNKKALCND
ncbi:MAG: helix-turn-helix transcriptional regulator [Proteobacteria bacterium]|nr:helix-turn-helix transcriptional regulator [Pseudomonadota bacterium]